MFVLISIAMKQLGETTPFSLSQDIILDLQTFHPPNHSKNHPFICGYVLGSKLPLFPYNRGWSSTQ